MTNKYIIKNCPAMADQGNCFQGSLFLGTAYQECCERTDCLLKQIVDKCKEQNKPKSCREYDTDIKYLVAYGRHNLANEILSMLEIKECE